MLHKLISPMKEFGIFPGTLYLIDRVLTGISPNLRLFYYELMVQPVPDSSLIRNDLIKKYSTGLILSDNPHIMEMPVSEAIIHTRFDQNATCLGLYRQEELVGYIWLAFGNYHEDEVRFLYSLDPGISSSFDFDLYIFPKHRGGLSFIALWERANDFLRKRGIQYTYSRVSRFNIASRNSHKRLGAACVGKTIVLKAWKAEFTLANLPPYAGVTVRDSDTIKFRLHHDKLRLNEGSKAASQ